MDLLASPEKHGHVKLFRDAMSGLYSVHRRTCQWDSTGNSLQCVPFAVIIASVVVPRAL